MDIKNSGDIVPLLESSGRAVGNTLAAEGTVGHLNFPSHGNVYRCAGACIGNIPYIQALNFITDLDAAHTFNTLTGIPYKREGGGPFRLCVADRVLVGNQIQIVGDFLQGAVSASNAGRAFCMVLRENQLYISFSGFPDTGAVCNNFHSLCYQCVAGGNKTADSGYFYDTDTAGADLIDIL